MSGLEDEIWQRIQRQEEAEEALRNQQSTQEALALEREREEAAHLEQAIKAGQAVVALLTKYNLPTKEIWEQRVVGKKPYQGFSKSGAYTGHQDVNHYFNTGRGWHIYTLRGYVPEGGYYSSSRAAITTEGRAITFEQEIGSPGIPRHGDKGNKNPVTGIVHPRLLLATHTLQLLESDDFQNGIASLVREKGANKQ